MSDDPKVSIGGREFPVPELSILQLRKVFPAMGKLARIFNDPANALASLDDDLFALLLETIFVGIAPGSANFTKADFDKLPAKPIELVNALQTIALQSGMASKRTAREGETDVPGEALAAESIGTQSSPKSAPQPDGAGTTLNEPSRSVA